MFLAIAILLWGVSNVYAKFTLEFVSVGFYAGVKYSIAAAIFLLLYTPNRKKLFGRHFKEILLKSVLTLVSLTLFYMGVTKVTGFTTTMIMALTPIFLFVASIEVVHEKLKLRVLSGLAVALTGVILMIITTGGSSTAEEKNTILGVVLLLAAILIETASVLVSKKILKERVPAETLAGVTLAVNGVYFLAMAIWQVQSENFLELTAKGWILTIISGLVFTLVPWSLYYKALKNIDLEEVSVFGYLGPVSGAVASVLILGEKVTVPIVVGSGLVLLGLWLSQHKAVNFNPHFHALHPIKLGKNLRTISAKIINS